MCDCEKIQKDWQPKLGDFVWHDNEGDDYMGAWEFPAEHGIVLDGKKEYWLNWLWLPRQDQIQEMIEPDCYKFLYKLDRFIEKEDKFEIYGYPHADLDNVKTLEQLYISLYMKEKHNKVWDGEKWKLK